MATVRMMQGDSYALMINLTQMGGILTPDLVADIEISIGDSIRKTYSGGEVLFDSVEQQWYIKPTQEETLALEPGGYEAIARIKFSDADDADVKGINIGRIIIIEAPSEEVI